MNDGGACELDAGAAGAYAGGVAARCVTGCSGIAARCKTPIARFDCRIEYWTTTTPMPASALLTTDTADTRGY